MRDVGDELSLGNELNPEPDTQAPDDELLSGTPAVQMRQRKRNIKAIDFDNPAELRNSDLAQWNVDYTRNMTIAAKLKQNNRIITVAKKNAAFWVLGAGIASVGVNIGICGIPHPLEAFFGEQLLGALTGNPLKTPRRKRKRDAADGPDEEEAGRTIRQRVDGEDELGREAGEDLDDAPGFLYDVRNCPLNWTLSCSRRSRISKLAVKLLPLSTTTIPPRCRGTSPLPSKAPATAQHYVVARPRPVLVGIPVSAASSPLPPARMELRWANAEGASQARALSPAVAQCEAH